MVQAGHFGPCLQLGLGTVRSGPSLRQKCIIELSLVTWAYVVRETVKLERLKIKKKLKKIKIKKVMDL